jgi:hypothetical protein
MQQVLSRDGQEMLLDLEETGPQQTHLQCGTSFIEAVLCSGAATERHIMLRRPAYGALLRPDIPHRTHAYMRAAEGFPAVTPPWTALFSSAAVHPRPIAAGVNPHSCELGTETMPLRTA